MEIGRDARLKSEVAQLLNEKAQLQVRSLSPVFLANCSCHAWARWHGPAIDTVSAGGLPAAAAGAADPQEPF